MKQLALIVFSMFILNTCEAQSKRDTVMLDSTKVEEINKMPMDTANQKMPIAPLTPKDSLRKGNQIDDSGPKKSKSTKKSIIQEYNGEN